MNWPRLSSEQRDELLQFYYNQLVLGKDSGGQQLSDAEPIDLLGWVPPEDWGKRVLVKSLADEGESQTLETLDSTAIQDGATVARHLEDFIRKTRTARRTVFPDGLPISVLVLACLKQHSPLPAELWRISIFGKVAEEPSP